MPSQSIDKTTTIEQVEDVPELDRDSYSLGITIAARQQAEQRVLKLILPCTLGSLVLHVGLLTLLWAIQQAPPPTPAELEELISFEFIEIEPVPRPAEPEEAEPEPPPVPEPPPPAPEPPPPAPEPATQAPPPPTPGPPPPVPEASSIPEPLPEPVTQAPPPVPVPRFTPLADAFQQDAEPSAPVASPEPPPAPTVAPEPAPTPVAALPPPPVEPEVLARPLRSALVPPDYPSEARRQGREGVVLVRARVTADGKVADVLIARSSGYSPFDEAALDAVRRWRFAPAKRGDTPIESWVVQPIRFNLN